MAPTKWDDKQFTESLIDKLMGKLDTAGMIVEAAAKRNCPVKTGTAWRSITREPIRKELTMRVGSNVDYFIYFELGTEKQAAQFPLTRALEESIPRIARLF
jgi:HK97 gp10 family phage protein